MLVLLTVELGLHDLLLLTLPLLGCCLWNLICTPTQSQFYLYNVSIRPGIPAPTFPQKALEIKYSFYCLWYYILIDFLIDLPLLLHRGTYLHAQAC